MHSAKVNTFVANEYFLDAYASLYPSGGPTSHMNKTLFGKVIVARFISHYTTGT